MYKLCILSFCTFLFSAMSWAQTSGGSNLDWTDTTLVPNSTPIKAAHINELRARINQNLVSCGQPAFTWTDDPVIPRLTPIKRIHIAEIRTAASSFVQAKAQRQRTQPQTFQFTDPTIVSGHTVIKATHLSELRTIASEPGCGPIVPNPPANCTLGNGTLGTNFITGQACWRTFSRNANGNFCEEENAWCPPCQPSNVYATQAACNVTENGNCQAVAGGWSCIP